MNFVTGGTGLLGSHLLYDLLSRGEKVRALKRTSSNIEQVRKVFSYYNTEADNLFNQIEWVDGDVLDLYSLKEALEGADHVYHCAAIVSFDAKKQEQIIQDNLKGTANLVNACLERNIIKYCQVSSIAAIGKSELSSQITEEGMWQNSKNKSAYSVSKHLSEMEVWRGIAEGLNAVIVNPSIILGPGNWNSGSSKIFSTIYGGLRFYTKGVTGYVDVRDVSKAMILLMKSDINSQRFIVSSENLSYEYVFKKMASNLGIKKPDIYARKWVSEIGWRIYKLKELAFNKPALLSRENARTAHKSSYYSSQKLIEHLDFKFIPIEQSIKDISRLFLTDFK
ncbi:MAG: NAD-dependent epimerase [Bacteroidetes bacterium HGW-Bacteroidetes-17]|jgi:nucleoside-diphosphate-sugar epimerase|nr:MAG: NAD-dependent epimerase [Bacteroidetes bacterium HGW-Bacteroidetes-17]